MDEMTRKVRYEIFQWWLEHCRPPITSELAEKSGLSETQTVKCLQQLDELHHIKLYRDETPSSTPIAMAHPFSHIPTAYVVCQGSKSWWANCAWCAMGLAAMLSPREVHVNVISRSSGKQCRITTVGGKLKEPYEHYFITFSPAPSRWWDDVRFACSTIQICESKEEADVWFSQYGFARGDVLDLQTVWNLSKAWYGDKHEYGYNRKLPHQVKELFKELGMTAPYWST